MTGRHVIGERGVLAVAARSHVHGDPLALGEDLHGAAGEPHLDLAAGEAVGNADVPVIYLSHGTPEGTADFVAASIPITEIAVYVVS